MAQLTEKEQDDGRNAVVCLKGFILQLYRQKKISKHDKDKGYEYLEKINNVMKECPPEFSKVVNEKFWELI